MDHAGRLEPIALVVDDDVFVLSAIAESLSEEGYDVHTASNGFSALRQATEYRPAVVLLDLVLPERSGADVLTDLRGDPATHDMAIVVVTGHPQLLTKEQIAASDGVVVKPFDIHDLLSTVNRAFVRAASRHAEVVPVAVISRREPAARQRRAASPRRTRGRR
ncbi:MAG: response regulator [Chloroflexi bacterium]|nr:response regulator [Chloroflexota bacterium]